MITDEMIAEAAAKYNDALIQYWQNVEMEEHEFSSKFERKMCRLIWKVKFPYMHKALKSAACILIAFLISFASVMTFNVEARAAFTRWIREVYEDSIVYEFFGEKSETASLDYRVTWIPEGYELVEEFDTEISYAALYQKGNDYKEGFVVEWSYVESGDKIALVTYGEEYQCEDIYINGYRGSFYKSINDNNSNILFWVNEDEMVEYHLNSYLSLEDMAKIAENIKK
ncbi:MAG: DUF4367 domain-containing protein [Oscillospiraceae bacterium]|nr:DUF4367 domain-containing protein [Oscillospiraceae bacterium]